jgi:hypothetical protein
MNADKAILGSTVLPSPSGDMQQRVFSQPLTEACFTAACAIAGVLIGIVPWLMNSRAYFLDDNEAYFIPTFAAIGASLLHGHMPLVTVQSYVGGNLLGEYQYALFNPVTLLGCIALALLGNMAGGAAVLAIAHYAILCAGVFALARACSISRSSSVVAAVAFTCNNFVFYWLATGWFCNFIGLAWFAWAMAFMMRAHEGRGRWLLAVAFATMTLASGSYYVDLILALCVTLTALAWAKMRFWRRALLVLLGGACAGLLAAPAGLPLLAAMSVAVRAVQTVNTGFLVPNLASVLAVSSPFHLGILQNFNGDPVARTPMFFAGWFLLPVLPFIDWSRFRWNWPAIPIMAGLAAIALVGTQGPEQWGVIRWPFRFIPYFHLGILLVFAAAIDSGIARPTPRRVAGALALVGLGALTSIQAQPMAWPLVLGAGALICSATVSLTLVGSSSLRLVAVLLLPGILLLAATRWLIPENENVPNWRSPAEITRSADLDSVPVSYMMYLGSGRPAGGAFESKDGLFGQMPLARGEAHALGYSPIGFRAFSERLCLLHGFVCPDAVRRLSEDDPDTGLSVATLMRIGRLAVDRGEYLEQSAPWLARGWRRVGESKDVVFFERDPQPAWPPGSISWVSPNLQVRPAGHPRSEEESYEVVARSGHNDRMVFARLSWPGYEAEFGGRVLPIRRHLGFLVAIDLPDGEQVGTLVLRWKPPFLGLGAACAILASIICGFVVGLWPWRWRAPVRASKTAQVEIPTSARTMAQK